MTAADVIARIRAVINPPAAAATPETAPAPVAPRGLQQPALFFNALRGGLLGPALTPAEVQGCEAILKACDEWPLAHTAYALATAYHETAHTMQPVREMGGPEYLRRNYDLTGLRPDKARLLGNTVPGDGVRFSGRGYVQITGRNNYKKAEEITGRPLAAQPDLALQPDIAANILRSGLSMGWFTGKRLANYLPDAGPATRAQFTQARRVVNGLDRADDIAVYALSFQEALERGLWS